MTWQEQRDRILLGGGLLGIGVLLVVWIATSRAPDPLFMAAFGGMIGAPIAIRKDQQGHKEKE